MILLQVSGLDYGLIEDYFPLIISNILVLLFFLFFQSNKQKADTAYKSHIAELEARSLRAQMNPHFILQRLKQCPEFDDSQRRTGVQSLHRNAVQTPSIYFGNEHQRKHHLGRRNRLFRLLFGIAKNVSGFHDGIRC